MWRWLHLGTPVATTGRATKKENHHDDSADGPRGRRRRRLRLLLRSLSNLVWNGVQFRGPSADGWSTQFAQRALGDAVTEHHNIDCGRLEPAAALEEGHQDCDGYDLSPDAEPDERGPATDVSHEPAEVLAEEAGDERKRQEDGRDHRQLLHHNVESVGDGREEDVHRAREQVAVGVNQIADSDQ